MRRQLLPCLLALALLLAFVAGAVPAQDGSQSRDGSESMDEPPRTREWLWRFVAGGATVGTGAFSEDGTYYFAAEDRYLYAVDRNGTMIWRTDLGRRPAGSVVRGVEGSVFVTLDNGEMLALNPDGRLIWRVQVSDDVPLAPVVLSNGMIFTIAAPGTLEARTHAGRLLWRRDLQLSASAPPVLAPSGHLVVAGSTGDYVLVSVDGRIIRRRYIGEVARVVVTDGALLLAGSRDGRVVAMDGELEPLWRADVGSSVLSLVVAATGDIYATSEDGSLSRITADGAVAWKANPGAAAIRSVLAADELLLTVADGVLTRLRADGVARWQMRLQGRPTTLAMAPYGAAIVTTETWVSYAYPVGFRPDGPWARDRGAADRRGVWPPADGGRVDLEVYEQSVDYLALRARLLAGGQSEQTVAMSDIASRVASGDDLAGEYQYLLQLTERVAGSPYFGPLTQFGPQSAPRRARDQAIEVLGEIGDLATSRFLARLLHYEPDPTLQGRILQSMAALGTPVDAELAGRLAQIVRRDVARGPTDGLGASLTGFVEAAARYRGGYIHAGVADVLLEIATANYSRRVREYALETLRALAGGRAP